MKDEPGGRWAAASVGREWGSTAVRWGVSGAAQVCGGPVAVRGGSRGRKATEGNGDFKAT